MNLENKYIFCGNFGLERETLRVTDSGSLAQSPHPFGDNNYLDRDFCENQLELITPVCSSIDELFKVIESLDKTAEKTLAKTGEYMWRYSNPPYFGAEEEIPIARFEADKAPKLEYRMNLERRYGKRIMLYSGIHFNFSFSEDFFNSLCKDTDYNKFKTDLYFRLSKQVFRYSWLLVLLTSASPVYDVSLDGDYRGGDGFDGYSSRRNGDKGYWNKFIPVLNYENIHTYIDSIREYMKNGDLLASEELYLPVRLKPRGSYSLDRLENDGINHMELRMFDVNPLAPLGIFREDARFAHYYLIYLLSLPDFDFTPQLQEISVKNHQAAAKYDISQIKINGYSATHAALGLLNDMAVYFSNVPEVLENIEWQKKKITENKRYCIEVYEKFHDDYNNKMFIASKER